ncbi:MAG: hypothetical protein ABI632_00570 [Pseudolysinimonas sp.]
MPSRDLSPQGPFAMTDATSPEYPAEIDVTDNSAGLKRVDEVIQAGPSLPART